MSNRQGKLTSYEHLLSQGDNMSNHTTTVSNQKASLLKQGDGAVSLQEILKSISDDKSLLILQAIADVNSNTGEISLKKLGLSRKQYYSRISAMMKSDLIKRTERRYYMTPLGRIVYGRIMVVENAINYYYYNLTAIEAIEGFDIPNEEFTKLVDALIDNQEIKESLTKKC